MNKNLLLLLASFIFFFSCSETPTTDPWLENDEPVRDTLYTSLDTAQLDSLHSLLDSIRSAVNQLDSLRKADSLKTHLTSLNSHLDSLYSFQENLLLQIDSIRPYALATIALTDSINRLKYVDTLDPHFHSTMDSLSTAFQASLDSLKDLIDTNMVQIDSLRKSYNALEFELSTHTGMLSGLYYAVSFYDSLIAEVSETTNEAIVQLNQKTILLTNQVQDLDSSLITYINYQDSINTAFKAIQDSLLIVYKENNGTLYHGLPVYGSDSTQGVDSGYFRDKRDGRIYRFVTVGTQKWMAENLKYMGLAQDSCLQNDTNICAEHGTLYKYRVKYLACPRGWDLPTYESYNLLLATIKEFFLSQGDTITSSFLYMVNPDGWPQGDYEYINGIDYFGLSFERMLSTTQYWVYSSIQDSSVNLGSCDNQDIVGSYLSQNDNDAFPIRCIAEPD